MIKIKKESGQGLAEFALVLPILIILLIGIFDVGRVIFIKTNLQHLSAEIHKMTSLYSEKGTVGGIQGGAAFSDLDEAIQFLLDSNQLIDSENLVYEVNFGDEFSRPFERYNFDNNHNRFLPSSNRHDAKYVRVRLDYELNDFFMFSNFFNKNNLKLSHEYTGLIFVGSDGYDAQR